MEQKNTNTIYLIKAKAYTPPEQLSKPRGSYIEFYSIVKRAVGAKVKYLGVKWIVEDCAEAI